MGYQTAAAGPGMGRLFILATTVSMLVLAACSQAPAQETSSRETPLKPTTPAVASAVETEPSATAPTQLLVITATPIQSPSPLPVCEHNYFFEPAPASCPREEPTISAAAEQPFEGGVMIWLEATNSVYVFYKDQRWQRFDDTWSEDLPESDPNIVPPDGRYQPIRGFGKVWREQPEVRERLGWALGPELGFGSVLQEEQEGSGELDVIFLLTFNGQVFALVGRGPDGGDWVIAAS